MVTVADVNKSVVSSLVDQYSVTVVDPNVIHTLDVDVFAPCAIGAVLNDSTIPQIRELAVCGLQNILPKKWPKKHGSWPACSPKMKY